ncbi:hypothetical protein [Duganella sp. P38]|uniref:hypothetical protein n=1 Tax=Duganella sp. P38 TaxID=3423949 RepID=UPI003D7B9420
MTLLILLSSVESVLVRTITKVTVESSNSANVTTAMAMAIRRARSVWNMTPPGMESMPAQLNPSALIASSQLDGGARAAPEMSRNRHIGLGFDGGRRRPADRTPEQNT